MRSYFLVLATAVALCGCDNAPSGRRINSSNTTTDSVTRSSGDENPAPDNSAVNIRDRDEAAKTPINQDEDLASVKTTAEIRKRVLAVDDLSVNARNVKIITGQGKVTLRGPVASKEERDAIERIANEVAGADKVENPSKSHLDVHSQLRILK